MQAGAHPRSRLPVPTRPAAAEARKLGAFAAARLFFSRIIRIIRRCAAVTVRERIGSSRQPE
jgi:hypothetical protein